MENRDDDAGDETERDDSVRERQSIAPRGQLPRHVAIVGKNSGQSREIRERSIRGEHQDCERAVLEHVVEGATTKDVIGQLRQNRIGCRRHHSIVSRQQAGAEKEGGENRDHPSKRGCRILLRRLLERHHAVGDCFGPRHRGAAFGKSTNEEICQRKTDGNARQPMLMERNGIDFDNAADIRRARAEERAVGSIPDQRQHH